MTIQRKLPKELNTKNMPNVLNLSSDEMTGKEADNFVYAVESTSNVSRYHGHCTLKSQSVADHSCRVSMLAYGIALEKYRSISKAQEAASISLFHDASEGLLKSDVNSTVKARYGIRDLIKKVEADVVNETFEGDSWFGEQFKSLFLEECSTEIYQILKISDTLDFGLFIHTELMLGNRTILPLFDSFKTEYGAYPAELRKLKVCTAAYNKILKIE